MKKQLLVTLLLTSAGLPVFANEFPNGDFEQGFEGWSVFNPDDNPGIVVDVGQEPDQPDNNVLRMTSDDVVRFSAASPRVSVQSGEVWTLRLRYRLPEGAASTADNTPGFLVRLTASDASRAGVETAHQHVDSGGTVHPVDVPLGQLAPVGADAAGWKTLKATFTVPDGIQFIHLDLFFWRMQAELWIDDIALEKRS